MRKLNTYRITILAVLAALGIVGRNAVAFIANVQPVTSIIMITGVVFGPGAAFLIAIVITFVSNITLGMGIWTIWQIVAWGLIGLICGIIGKYFKEIPLWVMIALGVMSGYFYGFVISLFTFQVSGHFLPYYIAGLPFDTNHAIGNACFVALLYPVISSLLKQYDKKH